MFCSHVYVKLKLSIINHCCVWCLQRYSSAQRSGRRWSDWRGTSSQTLSEWCRAILERYEREKKKKTKQNKTKEKENKKTRGLATNKRSRSYYVCVCATHNCTIYCVSSLHSSVLSPRIQRLCLWLWLWLQLRVKMPKVSPVQFINLTRGQLVV